MIDHGYLKVLATMARAELAMAGYQLQADGNPSEALTAARDLLGRLQQHGASIETWYQRLVASAIEAEFWLRQRGAGVALAAARRAFIEGRDAVAHLLAMNARSAGILADMARLDLVEAAIAERTGSDTQRPLKNALERAEQAVALDAQLADARLAAAEVYLQIATVQRRHDMAIRGLSQVDQALAINPSLAEAQNLRTALERL
jgi:hypothetical protein